MIAGMSDATAAVLLGSPTDVEAGVLAGLMRRTDKAMAVAPNAAVSVLTANVAWALNALHTYPATPQLPDMELVLPLPAWESL